MSEETVTTVAETPDAAATKEKTAQSPRGIRKHRKGKVVSKSGDKSVVVLVERRYQHPVYGKQLIDAKKYHAHDEGNTAKVGDNVEIEETRPISKLKRWRISSINAAKQGAI